MKPRSRGISLVSGASRRRLEARDELPMPEAQMRGELSYFPNGGGDAQLCELISLSKACLAVGASPAARYWLFVGAAMFYDRAMPGHRSAYRFIDIATLRFIIKWHLYQHHRRYLSLSRRQDMLQCDIPSICRHARRVFRGID